MSFCFGKRKMYRGVLEISTFFINRGHIMKILSIGNSFSDDAQRYLSDIAKCDGEDLYTLNLYIPGCSLETHAKNIDEKGEVYRFNENGIFSEREVSIEYGIDYQDWDIVTIQQVSNKSFDRDSYYPYIYKVAEFARKHAPRAKILIHQTWAYEDNSEYIMNAFGDPSMAKMFSEIKVAYERAAREIGADAIIPSGELMMKLVESGIKKVHRDTFHADLGVGRYALGLLWYHVLTGKSVLDNSFADFDEPVSDEYVNIVKKCVESFEKVI